MQFTLTGFRHDSGLRVFQFQGIAAGKTRSDFFISADLTLIRTYGIRIQELPLLCLRVLEQREFAEQEHTLAYAEEDMRQYMNLCVAERNAAKKKFTRWSGPGARQNPIQYLPVGGHGDLPGRAAITGIEKPQSRIAPGAFLIRNDAGFRETRAGGTYPFSARWSFLTDSSARQELETGLATSGEDVFSVPGTIWRAATGVDSQQMIEAALGRVLAAAELRRCNCLKIDEVKIHSFESVRYASLSGHARRQSQGGSFPPDQPMTL